MNGVSAREKVQEQARLLHGSVLEVFTRKL